MSEEKRQNLSKEEIVEKMKTNVQKNLTAQRDIRVIPLAKFALQAIANHELLDKAIGSTFEEKDKKAFAKDLQLSIVSELIEKDALLGDASYIFRLCHQAIDIAMEMMQHNVQESTMRAEAYKWGMEPKDITFGVLHKVLLEATENAPKADPAEPVNESVEPTEPVDKPALDEPSEEKV